MRYLLAILLSVVIQTAGDGWNTLFDGTDLSHFDELGEAEWNIVDGYVEAVGGEFAYLVTQEDYADFELELEFWPGAGANSGVYLRCQNRDEVRSENGYEINIYDTNQNPDNRTGAVVRYSPPIEQTMTEEKWNKYEIRAEGSHITVRLNGRLVNEVDDSTYRSGPIALQNNGGLIRFKNVRVRRL